MVSASTGRAARGWRHLDAVWAWGLITIFSASAAPARPFAVDDLLRVEQFSQILPDPAGRWLVIERRRAAGTAPRFDLETHKGLTLGSLLVVDLNAPAAARPLLTADAATGYVALAFSPRGRHLAVARLSGRAWELGVVDLATTTTRWLGVTPGLPGDGRAVQWLSESRLTVRAYLPGDLPVYLRAGWQTKHDLPLLWEQAATGSAVTATTVGSGRFRGVTPRPPAVRLVAIDLDRGTTRTIVEGAIVDFEAASTGRIAVILAGSDIEPTAAPLGVGTATQRRRLVLVDADGSHVVPVCASCDFAGSLLSWSPSDRQLLAFSRHDGAAWDTGALVSIDATTGRLVRVGGLMVAPVVAGPPDFAPLVHAGWSGETVVVYARPTTARSEPRADWFALDHGRATPLTAGLASVSPTLAAVDPGGIIVRDGDQLLRIGRNGRTTILWSRPGVRVAAWPASEVGERGRANPLPVEAIAGWWTTPNGLNMRFPGRLSAVLVSGLEGASVVGPVPHRAMVIVEQIDSHGTSHLLLARGDHPPVLLAMINAHLASVESARMVPIVRAGADGRMLTSWLVLPAKQRPGQRYPLVVVPYPGREFGPLPPRDQAPGAPLDSISAQVLAGGGYAVLLPSLPRGQGSGLAAAALTRTVLALVNQVDRREDIDQSRLALWGHSFGASAAVVIASQTDRFGSVVASGGLYDFISAFGTFLPSRRVHPEDGLSITTMAGWSETGQAHLGAAPWVDPSIYVANSPIFAAKTIDAPVLLLQGDQDIAALGQAEELFSALFRQNKDAVLASYWGEGHVVASPANLRDLYTRVFAWFDATLGTERRAGMFSQDHGGEATIR
ncbi:prolyl oligopeptidase family serine peptidase (plasmid) [Polymorphobacter sp. PAMC 29334]|uniref:S9 family peptidase n=1 Tax=Polymorphobacter sp. PAMC 29334 TaxID=2862331 RepID=UPI001C743919|nr:prolyl oligopeptidase family serine peptidase [Polymorphobacter sp. PAMC 29334]QYE37177.1 prolyl oligopeptidase family serine peptidase [Polymorphobacter sp. PAMC 29334]